MKRFGTTSLLVVGSLACSLTVRADDQVTPDNPYATIVARNVFGLVPPPPPPPPEDPAVKNPPPKITPNGIMSIFGKWQALFKVMPVAKPGEPPPKDGFKEESHVLGEGESEDDITVVKINSKDGIVTFDNHGITQVLPIMAANPSSGTAAPGGPPGAPGAPGMPGPGGRFGNRPGMPGMFGGGRLMSGNSGMGASGMGANQSGQVPSGGFGGGAVGAQADSNASAPLTPEERILQDVSIEKQRNDWIQQNNPAASILPPTSMTSALNPEAGDSALMPGHK